MTTNSSIFGLLEDEDTNLDQNSLYSSSVKSLEPYKFSRKFMTHSKLWLANKPKVYLAKAALFT